MVHLTPEQERALGVRYVDLQRPSIPIELGAYDTRASTDSGTSGCWGVYPFDPRGYIYASDIQSGLFVFEYAPTGGALTGVVRDEQTQQPIPGGAVQLLTHGGDLSINASGEFGEHLDAGDVVLRATAPGYASKIVVAGEMTVGGGIDVEIDLTPLPKGSVTGTVVNANTSAPISGAIVSVIDSTQQTTTNGSGQFTLPDIAIGQRIISVDKPGFSGDEETIVLQTGAVETIDFSLLEAALVDDLELDTGWVRDSSDTATTGKWVRSNPVGTGGGTIQPEDDNTPAPGVNAYFTGQGLTGASAELQDVDGGTASLLSPVIDLSGLPSPTFRYHRWFSTQAGSLNGGTFRIQVSDDAGANWTTVEQLNTDANSWTPVSISVSDYVTLNDQFRVRFACEGIAELDQQRILECAVDDIEVVQECRARAVVGGLDSDFDGVLDLCDACPFDPVDDIDGDGLCADVDNAPFVANPAQTDTDADGVGDLADNCPIDANAGQLDLDRDGLGNACDNDIDGDGDDDTVDLDDDNDGVLDVNDLCPTVADSAQLDFDGDSIGDACDDGDGRVHGVRVDGDLIQWQPESGASGYNIYRSDLGAPILIQLAGCRASDLTKTQYTDTQLPQPGDFWAYLVAAEFGGVEQGVGAASDGTPRQVNAQCP